MVTVAFPPRLVAMETAAPCPSRSPHRSFRSPAFSTLHTRNADRLARTREISSYSLSCANLLSDDAGRLALSRSLLPSRRESLPPRREGSRKRNTRRRQPADVCTCAILGPPRHRNSMPLRNSSITYQTRVTRNLVMHSRAMLIYGVREDLDASQRWSTRCRGEKTYGNRACISRETRKPFLQTFVAFITHIFFFF